MLTGTYCAFWGGATSKDAFPSLGHLLVTVLIIRQGLTDELTLAIVKEAILRNVVWMLDTKGAGVGELSYLEPSVISGYRLQRPLRPRKYPTTSLCSFPFSTA